MQDYQQDDEAMLQAALQASLMELWNEMAFKLFHWCAMQTIEEKQTFTPGNAKPYLKPACS